MRTVTHRPGPPLVVNVVWTGRTFSHLAPLVASQVAHSDAAFRFVANACPADEVDAMETAAAGSGGRVVDVTVVATDRMVRHGDALDAVLRRHDDGPAFAFMDPDIAARGPFLDRFRALLADHDAVTSGREVWSDGNVRPEGHPGVNGEIFYDTDGFTFGSPHLAIYRRDTLLATLDRWHVGFSSAGNDISPAARARLQEVGRSYWIYDTGKIVNILLQADGGSLVHEESPNLVHVGGVAHYLAPPSSAPAAQAAPPVWGEGPDWGRRPGMAARHAAARDAAEVIEAARRGEDLPPLPDVEPGLRSRIADARAVLVAVVAAHGEKAIPGSR